MTETTIAKRKPGRPKSQEPYRCLSFTLSDDLYYELVELAECEQCTNGALVQRSLRFYFDNKIVAEERALEHKIKAIADVLSFKE